MLKLMNKNLSLTFLILLNTILLISCNQDVNNQIPINDDEFNINIKNDNVKILQLTDLHLTYGFDHLDRKTFKLIDQLVLSEQPDVILVTGDIFMSIIGKSIIKKFIKHMDKYNIPWTFIFGNHEADFLEIEDVLKVIQKIHTNNLYFTKGPKLSDDNTHGNSNFKIKLFNNEIEILNLYLLDSKANRTDGLVDKDFPYDYVSDEQVKWYQDKVSLDIAESLLFVHIPLMEYLEYDGVLGEKIWPQGKDTNLFETIKNNNKTLGVFVGHDHLNNFSFIHEGITLAYGNTTGYNAYGNNLKGGRIIEYNYLTKKLNTYVVLESEVMKWKINFI